MYAGQEATVRTGHETTDWFQIAKGVCQGCILSHYLTNMQSISWEMLDWRKHKLESRLLEEISVTSYMQMTPPLWQKWRTKEPLEESERGKWKSWLKTQTFRKLRSWHPVPSFHGKQLGEKMETVADFIFSGSKITVDSDCSHEIRRRLLPGIKAMTNLHTY